MAESGSDEDESVDTSSDTDADRGTDTDYPPVFLDVMLGKLATYLRMCGYNAAYALDRGFEDDDRILEVATDENRLLITRDEQLANRTDESVLLTKRGVEDQLRELRDTGFALALADEPAYCGQCNGPVERVASEEFDAHDETDESRPGYVPDEERVWQCQACKQYFWKGSHWEDVGERVDEL